MIPWYWIIVAVIVGILFGVFAIALASSGRDE